MAASSAKRRDIVARTRAAQRPTTFAVARAAAPRRCNLTGTTSVAKRDGIFISYRRDDARGASGRLYDWLRIGFGRDQVFRDVASIGVGRWRDKIDAALARSAVCVAVVGTRWANADNLPRLHDPADMVRHELITALGDPAVTIVPTLVEDARLPAVADLPPELRALFDDWNARPVSESGWEDDTRRLIDEIAAATGLGIVADLNELMAAQRQLAALEQQKQMQAGQIEALNRTVDEMRTRLADAAPAQRAGLAAAFAALARGESAQAEDAFEREYEAQRQAAEEARRTAAEAARNVANLALLRDVTKAVVFYRKALVAEPDDAETARLLGHALMTLGDLQAARIAMAESLRLAQGQSDTRAAMWAQIGLGDIHVATGDLGAAQAAYAEGLKLAQQRLSVDPANTEWQRDLSVSHDRIGDVLVAQGDGPAALQAFRKGMAIAEALAARDPANTQWQRDLSISHDRIGDVLVTQGDGPAALQAFRKGLAIREALAARDPANTQWQRELSISHDRIGNVLVAQGDGPAALQAFRKGLAIREALAARDPANTQWQRDLSISHDRIGNVLVAQGDGPAALQAFRKGLAIAEALAARDPANAGAQVDLAISLSKVGTNAAVPANERARHLRTGLHILESLAARGRLMPNEDHRDWFRTRLGGVE